MTGVQTCALPISGARILAHFTKHVEKFYFDYGRHDVGIEQAAWELFRENFFDNRKFSFTELAGFVVWYDKLKEKISESIGHLDLDRGDDGFGDLCDSLPLAGSRVINACLATHKKSNRRRDGFMDCGELETAVKKNGLNWFNLICHGENYVASTLKEQAEKAVLSEIRRTPHVKAEA